MVRFPQGADTSRVPSMMSTIEQITNFISAHENGDPAAQRRLTSAERGELIAAACRLADAIETSRIEAGAAPSRGSPWPDSTWNFLAECARRVRET